jgi:hypothetical protein
MQCRAQYRKETEFCEEFAGYFFRATERAPVLCRDGVTLAFRSRELNSCHRRSCVLAVADIRSYVLCVAKQMQFSTSERDRSSRK